MYLSVPSRSTNSAAATHPYQQFGPRIWELARQPNFDLLTEFLRWTLDDEVRRHSAIANIQWVQVGIHTLTIAISRHRRTGQVKDTLQLNFYSEEHPGNEHPHAHSHRAQAWWCARERGRQIITRVLVLPPGARPQRGINLTPRQLGLNCLEDRDDGGRPAYRPILLGERLTYCLSVTEVAPAGLQRFDSLEVHYVGYRGPGVAISVHTKTAREPLALSRSQALMTYKGLTAEEAERVTVEAPPLTRLPRTLFLPPLGFDPDNMAGPPRHAPLATAEALLLGGLDTSERRAKR